MPIDTDYFDRDDWEYMMNGNDDEDQPEIERQRSSNEVEGVNFATSLYADFPTDLRLALEALDMMDD